MATVPLSGTNIRLLSNIPFNNDYKHSRWFTSRTSQTNYFTGKPIVHSMTEANFQRIEGKHFVSVNKHIDSLWGTNYMMFQNRDYGSKWFYAFVTKLEYKTRGTTYVHFEIDVLQTWRFDMNFKPSYVVREHRPLWNNDGTPVINTIDEELQYGLEYDNVYVRNIRPMGNYKWLVIISKEVLHGSKKGEVQASMIGTPQPLSYYLIPFSDSGNVPNIKSGSDSYPVSPPDKVLSELYKDETVVNNIVSIFVTDYIGVETRVTTGSPATLEFTSAISHERAVIGDSIYAIHVNSISEFISQEIYKESKYEGVPRPTESKLLMYPYTVFVLDDFKGNRVEFMPEFINDKEIKIRVRGSLGTSNFVSYTIHGYNRGTNVDPSVYFRIDNENAMINNAPEDISVLNESLAAFLQGNRNSINTQRSQIQLGILSSILGGGVAGVGSGRAGNMVGMAGAGVSAGVGMGEGVLQLQAIQSKIKDISNVPPQISKMGSNTAYNSGNRFNGVWLIKKHIKPEYRKILSDFFNMFGYKTNQVKVPNFRTRQNWNYVETKNCVITGNFNNEDLQELKNIFDNGITLWHTDDIGNYDLANGVR